MPKKTDVKNSTTLDRFNAAQEAVNQIKQKYGEGSIMKLGETKKLDVEVIPTGCLSLDIALGVGGVPRGRIIEIYGPEASGKTTLAQHIVAELQKRGGTAAFIDAGDQHMGLQARLMSQALRKLSGIVSKSKTVVIFINQIRMRIGIFFGNPETTTGGMALKFYSSVRIEVRRAAQIKKGDEVIGNRVKAKVVKNKVAPPFKGCEFDIMYNEGISIAGDTIDSGVSYGVINKSGNSYVFEEEKLGVGRETAKDYLRANPKLIEKIKQKVWEKVKQEGEK